MQWMMTTVVIALLATACTSTPADTAPPTTLVADDQQTTTTDAATIAVPPEIADYDAQSVQVGDTTMLLAIADSPALRAQGLMGVTDLGDLDGMLFFWRHDGDSFWMKDTLIPLDVVWFNEDGTYKDRASMVPCTETPCPKYAPDDFDFRFAIEAPTGALDWVGSTTVIQYSD
jgi:uncharacterized membrane protein (UPF0127 family)